MKLWTILAAFALSFLISILVSSSNVVNAQSNILLAQQIRDADLLGQIQHAFNNFVHTGQVWALLIGLVIGYLIRNLTSYG